jgi:hypothetical protein
MHAFRRRKPHTRRRRRNQPRPYLIDIEDFETVEDIEMDDWMFGSSGGNLV